MAGAAALLFAGCGAPASSPSPAGGASLATGKGLLAKSNADAQPNWKEQYTIMLFTDSSDRHVEAADYWKTSAQKFTGWSGLFVVHEEQGSMLCWNHYDSVSAANGDLKKAKQFRSPTGQSPFTQAITIPLPGTDFGPPQWSLLNAKGAYTVLVGVYYDVPEEKYIGRKKFAVECVKRLREAGYEAYYFHGPARSHVCVGTFPDESVEKIRVVVPDRGETYRNEVKDPRIIALLKQFPDLSINETASKLTIGVDVDPKTHQPKRIAETVKSTVVGIPKDKAGGHL